MPSSTMTLTQTLPTSFMSMPSDPQGSSFTTRRGHTLSKSSQLGQLPKGTSSAQAQPEGPSTSAAVMTPMNTLGDFALTDEEYKDYFSAIATSRSASKTGGKAAFGPSKSSPTYPSYSSARRTPPADPRALCTPSTFPPRSTLSFHRPPLPQWQTSSKPDPVAHSTPTKPKRHSNDDTYLPFLHYSAADSRPKTAEIHVERQRRPGKQGKDSSAVIAAREEELEESDEEDGDDRG